MLEDLIDGRCVWKCKRVFVCSTTVNFIHRYVVNENGLVHCLLKLQQNVQHRHVL